MLRLLKGSLETNQPVDYGDILGRLDEDAGIQCIEHLLLSSPEVVARRSGLPLQMIRTLYSSAILSYSPVFAVTTPVKEVILTGHTFIDDLPLQCVMTGCITEISGPKHCGKSRLCHSITSNLANRNERVIYIDTTGSSTITLQDDIRVLENVLFYQVTKAGELQELLTVDLPRLLDRGVDPKLLIVDSISAVLAGVLGGTSSDGVHGKGHGLMFALYRALKSLSLKYSMGVVVTNHVVKDKPALGNTWAYLPDYRLAMHSVDNITTL